MMNKHCLTTEALTRSSHDAKFLVDHLQDSLKTANVIEGIIILRLIEKTAKINQEVDELLAALESKNNI
jgi:hypothetical protein